MRKTTLKQSKFAVALLLVGTCTPALAAECNENKMTTELEIQLRKAMPNVHDAYIVSVGEPYEEETATPGAVKYVTHYRLFDENKIYQISVLINHATCEVFPAEVTQR